MSELAAYETLEDWPHVEFDNLGLSEYFFVARDAEDAATLWRLLDLESYPGDISYPALVSYEEDDSGCRRAYYYDRTVSLAELRDAVAVLADGDPLAGVKTAMNTEGVAALLNAITGKVWDSGKNAFVFASMASNVAEHLDEPARAFFAALGAKILEGGK